MRQFLDLTCVSAGLARKPTVYHGGFAEVGIKSW